MENKRVLLTGIGGSIAVHFLAHFMHNTDWEIIGIDSFRHKGWTDRVTEVLKEHEDWKPASRYTNTIFRLRFLLYSRAK